MDTTTAPSRPTLLTVICILSFIFGVWTLWDAIKDAFTDSPQQELVEARAEMEQVIANAQGPGAEVATRMAEEGIQFAERAVVHAKPMGYAYIVLSILSLLGVWLMWNLKRNGFWLYLVSAVAGLIVPVYFMGGGLLTMLGVAGMGLISLVFIILYAVSLKHMR